MTNSSVQSISTIALVLITIYYAWQTRKTVKELNNQRTFGVKPILLTKNLIIKDAKAWGGKYSCISCELENIGNGPAFKIHIGIYDPETDEKITASSNLIDYLTKDGTTDDNHIHMKNEMFDTFTYKQDKDGEMHSNLKVILHYEDLYENVHFSERRFCFEKKDRTFHHHLGTFDLNSQTIDKIKNKHKKFKLFTWFQ